MKITPEKMQDLEQRTLELARLVGASREMCEELALAELNCRDSVSGAGGSNSSLELLASLKENKFAFSRFARNF